MRALLPRLGRGAHDAPVDTAAIAVRYVHANGRPKGKFLLLIGCLSLFGPLCIDMYLPALPKIALNLDASASDIQLSLTACLVGLAVGQIVFGTTSDRLGRRPPLVGGLGLFIVSSLCCAVAPNAGFLVGFRFLQGVGGAAGIVISRAIVRDLFEGANAARVFSMLMLVTGAGPVLAPQIGAGLLTVTSWRGVFIALSIAGTVLLANAMRRIPETLAPDLRSSHGFGAALADMRRVGSSVAFLQHAVSSSLGFGSVIAYISGASFVIENIYHASPQLFGVLFGVNAAGMVVACQVNGRIVARFGSQRLMTYGLLGLATSSVAFLIVVVTHTGGLTAVVLCTLGAMCSNGFIGPNAAALSLQQFPDVAGSASALLGVAQFGLGAGIAPIVGVGGSHDAFPMAACMAIMSVSGLTARHFLSRRASAPTAPAVGVVEAFAAETIEVDL